MAIQEYPKSPCPKYENKLWYDAVNNRFWITGYVQGTSTVSGSGVRTHTHVLHQMEPLPNLNSALRFDITSLTPVAAYNDPSILIQNEEMVGNDGLFYRYLSRQSVAGQTFQSSNGVIIRIDPLTETAHYYNLVASADQRNGTNVFSFVAGVPSVPFISEMMSYGTPADGYLFCLGGSVQYGETSISPYQGEGANIIGLYKTGSLGLTFRATLTLPIALLPKASTQFDTAPFPAVAVRGRFISMPDAQDGSKRILYCAFVGQNASGDSMNGDFAIFIISYDPTGNAMSYQTVAVERRALGNDFFGKGAPMNEVSCMYDAASDRVVLFGICLTATGNKAEVLSLGGTGYNTIVWRREFQYYSLAPAFGDVRQYRTIGAPTNIAVPMADASDRPYTFVSLANGAVTGYTTIFGSVEIDRGSQLIQYATNEAYLSDSIPVTSDVNGNLFSMRVVQPDFFGGDGAGGNQRLLAWDSLNVRRPYRWRSKLFLNPIPASYTMAQVRAADYDDLTLRIYAQGQLIDERVVTSDVEFTIPIVAHTRTEIEIEGTSTVQTVQLVEDVRELT